MKRVDESFYIKEIASKKTSSDDLMSPRDSMEMPNIVR
jgi:hypothetical protein